MNCCEWKTLVNILAIWNVLNHKMHFFFQFECSAISTIHNPHRDLDSGLKNVCVGFLSISRELNLLCWISFYVEFFAHVSNGSNILRTTCNWWMTLNEMSVNYLIRYHDANKNESLLHRRCIMCFNVKIPSMMSDFILCLFRCLRVKIIA